MLSSSYAPNMSFCSYLTLTFAVASGYMHRSVDMGLFTSSQLHVPVLRVPSLRLIQINPRAHSLYVVPTKTDVLPEAPYCPEA